MAKKITQNVNKDKFFNDLPQVRPPRSQWGTKHTNYICANLGQIVPVYWKEVLPGQKKVRIDMAMISHTTTPIAPIFNSLYTEYRCFFVPMRLCADLLNGYKDRKSPWVKVFGEDNVSTSADIVVPLTSQKLPDTSTAFATAMFRYCRDRAQPDNVINALDLDFLYENGINPFKLPNYLNLAAYELIYQRHYRNENYESSTASSLYKTLYNAYNAASVIDLPTTFSYEIANREKDYFTGMKPFTQKGDSVRVSLGDTAPVTIQADGNLNYDAINNNEVKVSGTIAASNNRTLEWDYTGDMGSDTQDTLRYKSGLKGVANLSSVAGVSIEELRLLIKTQELLEKDAIYGSLYAESLNAHFGCCPLDLTLQDPQELFKVTVTSNMQAIFQTSSTSGESTILGTIGANSTTQTDKFTICPFTEFKEHGILMICAVHKLQNVYDSRFFKPKMVFKRKRFDFYTPELNDLGYQPVSDECRSISGTAGFNEAFADYRYSFNKVHGSLSESFPYWAPAISNEYASAAALYKEDTIILDKALSVASSTVPQFYDAYGFEEIEDMPMSLHSIPGMDGVI